MNIDDSISDEDDKHMKDVDEYGDEDSLEEMAEDESVVSSN